MAYKFAYVIFFMYLYIQSFGDEALFFCACFSARRCIKICKNQKYYLTYLHISEKSCNFASHLINTLCRKRNKNSYDIMRLTAV